MTFVARAENAPEFVKQLRWDVSNPIALFDADGTLWRGDCFMDFTHWMMQKGHLSAEGWEKFVEYEKIDPAGASFENLKFFTGMNLAFVQAKIGEFWAQQTPRWVKETTAAAAYLADQGCKICVVSASTTESLLPASQFLPIHHIWGIDFELDEKQNITGHPSGIAPVGSGKKLRVEQENLGSVVFAVGNSRIDLDMLSLSSGLTWAFEPDPILFAAAQKHGWKISPRK